MQQLSDLISAPPSCPPLHRLLSLPHTKSRKHTNRKTAGVHYDAQR